MHEPLGPLDRLFLRLETLATPMHVGGVLVFDRVDDARPWLDVLRAAPVRGRPFAWRLAGSARRPAWRVDEGAAPPVHHRRLDPPGDDAALAAVIADLHEPVLDRDRLLWECHVIDGLAGGRAALYLKMHHACVDGVSALRLLSTAFPEDPALVAPPLWSAASPRPAGASAPARARPGELARGLVGLARAARSRDPARMACPYTAPHTPLNEPLGARRSVAWRRLPLPAVRELARAAGVTVNDVALALCGAAVRGHLAARAALPDRSLVAMVPVDLRRADGDAGGNQVGALLCKLGTDVADPVARLRAVARSAAEGKRLIRAMTPASAAAFSLAYTAPAVAAQLAGLARWAPLPFNVVVSNVVGPRGPRYLGGAPLAAIYPVSALFERQALNVTLVSLGDHLDLGLIACARSVGDVATIADGMVAAFGELRAAIGR